MNAPLCDECKKPHDWGWKSLKNQSRTWCSPCSVIVRMRRDQDGDWYLWIKVEEFYENYVEPIR